MQRQWTYFWHTVLGPLAEIWSWKQRILFFFFLFHWPTYGHGLNLIWIVPQRCYTGYLVLSVAMSRWWKLNEVGPWRSISLQGNYSHKTIALVSWSKLVLAIVDCHKGRSQHSFDPFCTQFLFNFLACCYPAWVLSKAARQMGLFILGPWASEILNSKKNQKLFSL